MPLFPPPVAPSAGGGATYTVLGNSWFDERLTSASMALTASSTALGIYQYDFDRGATGSDYTILNTAGTVTMSPLSGGIIALDTGTTTSTNVRIFNTGRAVVPFNGSTDAFYVATRAKVTTTTDAQARVILCAVSNNTAFGANYIALIVTNGIMNLELDDGIGTNTLLTSWTVDTTAFHDFEICFNGTQVVAYVDRVPVKTQNSPANLLFAPLGSYIGCLVYNGSTAASRKLIIDKWCLITKQAGLS